MIWGRLNSTGHSRADQTSPQPKELFIVNLLINANECTPPEIIIAKNRIMENNSIDQLIGGIISLYFV